MKKKKKKIIPVENIFDYFSWAREGEKFIFQEKKSQKKNLVNFLKKKKKSNLYSPHHKSISDVTDASKIGIINFIKKSSNSRRFFMSSLLHCRRIILNLSRLTISFPKKKKTTRFNKEEKIRK